MTKLTYRSIMEGALGRSLNEASVKPKVGDTVLGAVGGQSKIRKVTSAMAHVQRRGADADDWHPIPLRNLTLAKKGQNNLGWPQPGTVKSGRVWQETLS